MPNCKLQEIRGSDPEVVFSLEYNGNGQLSKYTQLRNGTPRIWYLLGYDGERLVSRDYWTNLMGDTLRLHSRDSLIYNAAGEIAAVWTTYAHLTNDEKNIISYEYSDDGFPIKMRQQSVGSNDISGSMAFFWDGRNLVKRQYYSGDFETLSFEFTFKYRKGINYKRLMLLNPEDPSTLCQNLVKSQELKEFNSAVDGRCLSCTYEYKLNDQQLPVMITNELGDMDELVWDCN